MKGACGAPLSLSGGGEAAVTGAASDTSREIVYVALR